MEFSLVLPESEVASVRPVDPDIQVQFSAAAALQVGMANEEEPAQGFSRGVLLQLRSAQVIGQQEPQLGRVSGGRLQVGGELLKKVPLPFEFKGPVHLELAFANRAYLVAAGTGVSVRFEAEPNFTESLAC
jgi:hypothetical protein